MQKGRESLGARMFKIGSYQIDSPVLLAPMAGVTDLPMRRLCRHFGAGLTTSEMITSDTAMWQSRKSSTRLVVEQQNYPISMQIAGSDPAQLASAAQACVEYGAEIVDINMGCPAKKVCKKAAGSALLADEKQVERILTAVVKAVAVPVTLKTRTGTDQSNKNGVKIAKIAEDAGVSAIAIHGRTRACRFNGEAEYETVREVVNAVSIPVIANGDIRTKEQACAVLKSTQASALMIGRAALGRPWLFQELKQFLETGEPSSVLSWQEKRDVIVEHIQSIHAFYGEQQGVRIARKHHGWYCETLPEGTQSRSEFNQLGEADAQISHIKDYFFRLKTYEDKAA